MAENYKGIVSFEQLAEKLKESGKPYDLPLIQRAFSVANEAHGDQKRKSGLPYITHPLSVAAILIELGMDTEAIAAALLHDVVEDTSVPLETIKEDFGEEIALLVDGVTKLGKIAYSSREEEQAENIRKMLMAMSEDIRVIIIKLADRLHNMRTMEYMLPQKQRDKSLETMEVYAPIAHRLGMTNVKEELEDSALRYLDPVAYQEIVDMLESRQVDQKTFLETIKEKILERISSFTHEPHISSRVKSIYGIYRKVYMQGRAMEEIYDVFAVRVIVDTVEECYAVLGIIHDLYRPIPNRFKDYIATPKPNMYQSLHTTVIGKEGVPFEIQIRTWDMHHTAEYGIAAHWKYKLGIQGKDKLEDRLVWVRQLLEAQKESEDAVDIIRTIKSDLAPEETFVFTPKGEVINLPTGSTVIDFAYAIHSAVGNRMIGAKVDGRIVPIDFVLKTGQIVEILTTKAAGHGPSRDWLGIVKTSEARNKIRSWFKKERKEENIETGRDEIEREFRRNNIRMDDKEMEQFLLDIARRQHLNTVQELYAAIGYGGVILSRIMPRIKDEFGKLQKQKEPAEPLSVEEILPNVVPPEKQRSKGSSGVIVEGIDNCLVKFSKCCNPLPGDEIVGFITRGYGVSIHKKDCVNYLQAIQRGQEPERWVKAHWAGVVEDVFKSTIEIIGTDRPGLLADISILFSNMHIPIHALNARELKNKNSEILVTISINSLELLRSILQRLSKIEGVLSVERSNS